MYTANQNQLLNESQTAEMLGLTNRTLQAWRLQGKGVPFVRISKRCVRYRLADILEFIDERIKTSTSAE